MTEPLLSWLLIQSFLKNYVEYFYIIFDESINYKLSYFFTLIIINNFFPFVLSNFLIILRLIIYLGIYLIF